MSLSSVLSDAFAAVGADVGLLKELLNNDAANLNALTTTQKGNLVSALNEVRSLAVGKASINDSATNTTTAWSGSKVNTAINAAIAGIIDGAPGALDTLNELAAAFNDNPSIINNILAAQAKRVAVDQVQTFTAGEQLQACQNIGVGDPTTNFLSVYTTARDA